MNSVWKKIISLLVLIAVIVGAAYLVSSKINQKKNAQTPVYNKEAQRDVKVEKVDYNSATTPEAKKPSGFPSDIPTETVVVTDSNKTTYSDVNGTTFSFSYISQRSVSAKYKEYLSYMQKAGYDFGQTGKGTPTDNLAILTGTKDGNRLSVVISKQTQGTLVQIVYLKANQ